MRDCHSCLRALCARVKRGSIRARNRQNLSLPFLFLKYKESTMGKALSSTEWLRQGDVYNVVC